MNKLAKVTRASLVLSPQEPLVAGGPAEDFEQHVRELFRHGYRHLVADLRSVPRLDSAGVRALVRGHTTAQRMEGTFRLVAPNECVLGVLQLSRLDGIFDICDSLETARRRPWPWPAIKLVAGGTFLVGALVAGGLASPLLRPAADVVAFPGAAVVPTAGGAAALQPFVDVIKLVAASAIGILITAVSRRYRPEKVQTQSMEQAQVLLCVSGAMMMIIIGNSLARAFGIAGAASIIRFRTPVEDPKDITVLFLLMGLGMATGLGAFALAGMGAAFLSVALVVLEHVGARKPRLMTVEVKATDRAFPVRHVESVFARNGIIFEPREISQGGQSVVEYYTRLDPNVALDDVTHALIADGTAGIKSVVWEPARKKS
ncbi:MAG: STAS domain-containing protein [Bacteroidales bacterium]